MREVSAFSVVWFVAVSTISGALTPLVLVAWYLAQTGVALLDIARLLGAHRYLGKESDASLVLQMIDTINHPRSRVAGAFWGPVGLRMHALHDLMPGLPYHAYREAHARLVAALPAVRPIASPAGA